MLPIEPLEKIQNELCFSLFDDAMKRKQNVAKHDVTVVKVKKKNKDERINVFVSLKLLIGRIGF